MHDSTQSNNSQDDIAISVKGLSKAYRIWRDPGARLKAPIWDAVGSLIPKPIRPKGLNDRLSHNEHSRYYTDFYALNNISLEINKGDTVGILGRNGSGKSTLLQLICGTLTQTSGMVNTHGRISALLELGSGFNPEFTGRENVILNAAILGINSHVMEERLESVIEFSGLGHFIDQPTKTYSSGMFARLAFASAVHVDPDILIVDEALSVGDSGFQLKCMMKIDELREKGITTIFVSHETNSVARLCNRAVVLEQGNIIANSDDVLSSIRLYDKISRSKAVTKEPTTQQVSPAKEPSINQKSESYAEELQGIEERRMGSREAEYLSVSILGIDGEEKSVFEAGETITISATIKSQSTFKRVVSGFTFRNKSGVDIWGDNNLYANVPISLKPGLFNLKYTFKFRAHPGDYFLYIGLADLTNERVELDQRWPVRRISLTSTRQTIGHVFLQLK